MARWIQMPLGMEVGLSPGDCYMGTQLPSPKGGRVPQFLANVYCGQTAGWFNMALNMEVGLSPGHIVLHGDSAPLPKKGAEPPKFSAYFYCGQTAGCIKISLGMEVGLGPDHTVLDRDPAPPKKGGTAPVAPNFQPMSIVAKRLDGSRCRLVQT